MLSIFTFFVFCLLFIVFSQPVAAQCPVCIVTVGGGVLLAKELGIDDLLTTIWISALNTAISYYLASKIKVKFLNNPLLLSLLMFVTTLITFQALGKIGTPSNQLLGIDKIIFGSTLGLVAMIAGNAIYSLTKARNNGKALFPYSKVVFPVGATLLLTLIFKFAFNL